MSIHRRDFSRRDVLRGGLAAAALAVVPSACSHRRHHGDTGDSDPARRRPRKRILILGGTGFLGPRRSRRRSRVATPSRSSTGQGERLQPLEVDVEHLYGNRDPELPADDERGPDGKLLRPMAARRVSSSSSAGRSTS